MSKAQLTRTIAAAMALGVIVNHAGAEIVGPYTSDANTLHLWHLDEANPGPAADSGGGSTFALQSVDSATLGATALSGFGTAGDLTAATNSEFADASATPTTSVVGADGAFTFEVVAKFGNLSGTQQIMTLGSSAGQSFQLRIDSLGTSGNPRLFFVKVGGSEGTDNNNFADIPTTGLHAFDPSAWYHIAAAYNGAADPTETANNFTLFWTKVDDSVTEANELGSFSINQDLTGPSGQPFRVGNRGGVSEGLGGFVDEVRISDTARGASDFIFAPETNLVALWKFDETAGQIAEDSSGNGYDGQLGTSGAADSADPTINQPGKFANAYSFDGNNDLVDASTHVGDIASQSSGTLAMWFNTTATGRDGLFRFGPNGDTDRLIVEINGGEVRFLIRESATNLIDLKQTGVNDGQWHHLAVTQDGTTATLFIDGAEIASVADGSWFDTITGADELWLGSDIFPATAPPGTFDGLLDDIAIFDTALTSTQLSNLINLGGMSFVNMVPSPSALPAGLALLGLAAARRRR